MAILIVDDSPAALEPIAASLSRQGVRVSQALLCHGPEDSPHVVFTGAGPAASALRGESAVRCGYVELPSDHLQIADICLRQLHDRAVPTPAASRQTLPGSPLRSLRSPAIRTLLQQIDRLARVDSTVLITGESGVGKEVVAREIHRSAGHRRRAFVPLNCGAIPEGLVERELFGHKRGAFTDAVADGPGLIERADRGVLFLDEVGEMPLGMQVRLLRFLDSGEFRRVGDPTVRRADARIVAATNRPLHEEVHRGAFRADLFYRLNVVWLKVPPLRERPEDIGTLAQSFLAELAVRLGIRPAILSQDALETLQEYHWPGNVRELRNIVESVAVLASTETISAAELREALRHRAPISAMLHGVDVHDHHLAGALAAFGGSRRQTAAALGISRTTLWRRQRSLSVKIGE